MAGLTALLEEFRLAGAAAVRDSSDDRSGLRAAHLLNIHVRDGAL
jgi:hypothetical protein